jgi:hypothetical protein
MRSAVVKLRSAAVRSYHSAGARVSMAVASVVAVAGSLAFVAGAQATPTSAEAAVESIGKQVGEEGIKIFLISITAVAALLAVIIGVTLGIRKLKSFAK